MVTNFNVFWRPFKGFFINLFGCGCYHIDNLMLYDFNGNCVGVPLGDGVSFLCSLEGDIPISVRKKENYTRNEIFVIKRPKKYGEVIYDAYVPMGPADLKHIKDIEQVSGDGNFISHYTEYSFRGSYLKYWGEDEPIGAKFSTEGEDRLKMLVYTKSEYTEKKQNLDALADDIKATSGVSISSYDLERILEHYTMTKKV